MADGTHQLTSDQAGLLAAVLAEPSRDDLRLIFADWLDDAGDGERASFIRVQVRLAELVGVKKARCRKRKCLGHALPSADAGEAACPACRNIQQERDALKRRERELLEAHGAGWFGPMGCLTPPSERERRSGGRFDVVTRGFVSEITCDWPACRDHLGAVRRVQPVERVVLSSMPEVFSSPRDGRESMIVDLDMDGGCLGTGPTTRDAILHALSKRWPGVAFELPPEPPRMQDYADQYTEIDRDDPFPAEFWRRG